MQIIMESKLVGRLVFWEFLLLAAYSNAKLYKTYPILMVMGWVMFFLLEAAMVLLKKRRHKRMPNKWIIYKCMDKWVQHAVAMLGIITMIFCIGNFTEHMKERTAYNKVTVSRAEEILVEHKGRSILEHADV